MPWNQTMDRLESRSMKSFTTEVLLAIIDRMNRNVAPAMTVLTPATLLSIIPVLLFSYFEKTRPFISLRNIHSLSHTL
jgi:hypothetical protein